MGNGYQPLDTLSAADQQIITALNPGGQIPFVSFDGQYVAVRGVVLPLSPRRQDAGRDRGGLVGPEEPDRQAIVGAANVLTAAICATTNQQPANVCTSSGVKAGAAKLGS